MKESQVSDQTANMIISICRQVYEVEVENKKEALEYLRKT